MFKKVVIYRELSAAIMVINSDLHFRKRLNKLPVSESLTFAKITKVYSTMHEALLSTEIYRKTKEVANELNFLRQQ